MSKNFIEIEEACNNLWVTSEQIRVILGGCSKSKEESFRKELEKKLDTEKQQAESIKDEKEKNKQLAHCYYFNDTRPRRYPITRVLEEAHVDLDYVKRRANDMRKSMLLEKK